MGMKTYDKNKKLIEDTKYELRKINEKLDAMDDKLETRTIKIYIKNVLKNLMALYNL